MAPERSLEEVCCQKSGRGKGVSKGDRERGVREVGGSWGPAGANRTAVKGRGGEGRGSLGLAKCTPGQP